MLAFGLKPVLGTWADPPPVGEVREYALVERLTPPLTLAQLSVEGESEESEGVVEVRVTVREVGSAASKF